MSSNFYMQTRCKHDQEEIDPVVRTTIRLSPNSTVLPHVWPACCRNATLMCITYDSLDAHLQNFNRKVQTSKREMYLNLLISLIYLCSSPAYAYATLIGSRICIIVSYIRPVSRSRSPVLHPCPEPRSEESNSGGQIESVTGSSIVSEFSFIRLADPLIGGALYMKHASW